MRRVCNQVSSQMYQPGRAERVMSPESGTLEWSVMASVLSHNHTVKCNYEVQLETETKAFPRPYNALEI